MNFSEEIETLIRARYPIIYIVTGEELRAQKVVVDIAKKRDKNAFEWTYSTGIVPAGQSIQSQKHRSGATKDPLLALDQVIEQVDPAVYIFKDFHPFLTKNNFAVVRKLKDIALQLKSSYTTIVLISPVLEIPVELEKEITVLNFPAPGRDELAQVQTGAMHPVGLLGERRQVLAKPQARRARLDLLEAPAVFVAGLHIERIGLRRPAVHPQQHAMPAAFRVERGLIGQNGEPPAGARAEGAQ